MMTNRRALLFAGLALPFLPQVAFAHREKVVTSEVELKGTTFLITHTFHRHDAESALAAAGLIDRPDLSSLRARAHLALHVEATFSLGDYTHETLGAEVEGNRVFVYQQVELADVPDELSIRSEILRNLWGDQVNNVDVRIGGQVKSLRFEGDDTTKAVRLS